MRLAIVAVVVAAACACSSASGVDMFDPDAATPASDTGLPADAPPLIDLDSDGLDDADEQRLAADYAPFLSLAPDDGCPLSGLVARVRKHPADATKILIAYSHLFQRDCGLSGHVGDNEAFGVAVDPALPAPAGILAIRTASHQNTPCERITECTTCVNDSRARCDLATDAGVPWPVLYASKDKHGQYATKSRCSLFGTCFDQCALNPTRAIVPVVNVGEPGHPLITDLTAEGFITPANGWTEASLMGFDPWHPAKDFGSAGNVAGDLQDAELEPAPCGG